MQPWNCDSRIMRQYWSFCTWYFQFNNRELKMAIAVVTAIISPLSSFVTVINSWDSYCSPGEHNPSEPLTSLRPKVTDWAPDNATFIASLLESPWEALRLKEMVGDKVARCTQNIICTLFEKCKRWQVSMELVLFAFESVRRAIRNSIVDSVLRVVVARCLSSGRRTRSMVDMRS